MTNRCTILAQLIAVFLSCCSLVPLQGVEFWAANTDAQALDNSDALNKIQMGAQLTRGLGNSLTSTVVPAAAE